MQNSKHFNQNLSWKNIKWLDSQWIWFWIFEILIINIAISYVYWMSSNFIDFLASLLLTKLNSSSMQNCTVQVRGWRHHRFLVDSASVEDFGSSYFPDSIEDWICQISLSSTKSCHHNFQTFSFLGVLEIELTNWNQIYPYVDKDRNTRRMRHKWSTR